MDPKRPQARFTGKRTDSMQLPKQVRFPWDLAAHIRGMADREFRTIEYQILHLVIQGIRYEELLAEETKPAEKAVRK
jgi:hypothetical protein